MTRPTGRARDAGRSAGPGRDPARRRAVALAAGLLLLAAAAALRLHGLTRHPLWLDEANTVRIARLDPAAMIRALRIDAGAPLYYALLGAWMRPFGDSEASVRALSLLFGIALVPATGLLARRVAGTRAAWAAAVLTAATPIAVQFSQEARMYTLLPLLAALAAERLLAYRESGSRGALAGHAALLLAACYAHNWGLLLLPASAAVLALGDRARFRRWLAAAAVVAALYAPWVPILIDQAEGGATRFVAAVDQPPAWLLPLHSIVLFASGVGTGGVAVRSLLGPAGGIAAACLWGLLIGAGLARAPGRRGRLDLLILAGVPLALAVALGAAGRPVYVLGRYEMLVLPFLLALVAASAIVLVPPRAGVAILACWSLALAAGSFAYCGAVQRTNPEKALAASLAARLRPGDRVVVSGLYRAGLEYYLRRAGTRAPLASFPPDAAGHLGWYDESGYDASDPSLIAAARALCPAPGSRTWVVMTLPTPTYARLVEELERCARLDRPFAAAPVPLRDVLLATPASFR